LQPILFIYFFIRDFDFLSQRWLSISSSVAGEATKRNFATAPACGVLPQELLALVGRDSPRT
jgi:hypothetical protein